MKYLLNVVVLLELVNYGEHFRGLLFRQLGRNRTDVFVLGRQRRDAAALQRHLHVAEVGESAADDELRLALLARALAHLLQPVIDQKQLEVIVIDTFRVEPEHAHLLEEKADTAARGEVAAALRDDVAYAGDRAGRIVSCRFDEQGYAVRGVTFVYNFLVVGCIAAGSAFDRGLDFVLRP